ncbi:sigma-70 family RNA polymerase sigma factor [Ktedonobacteria bacterium brp13]|nr:sigma-70 family RNA polymerase sigma factor [Ktedonobacteria bacterium brp13]
MGLSFSEKDGRHRALMETLFREHYTEVHSFISNKVRQPDVADDLTSMVFLKAFRWLLEDRGMRQVRSWLYATARTTLADYWREQLKRTALSLEMIEDSVIVPCEQLENERTLERVQHLLSLLPAREREVLLLRYFQGYTAAEVGRELGLSAGHVRVLQLRALRQAALFETEERKLSQMNEKDLTYTEQGQRVLELAKGEALSLKHYYIGTEHLLLGILAEGSAAAPLIEQGTTLEHVRAGLVFLIGRDQGDPEAGIPLTPQSQHVLARAGQEAGEMAISPQHILYALQSAESEYGITYGMLQSLGVEQRPGPKQSANESVNESALSLEKYLIEQYPALSPEEELQLAHLVICSEKEKKRAKCCNESPDSHVVEEGKIAYFRLFMASQQLVFSVVKEYAAPGKDVGKLLEAGNRGLTYAIYKFGMKTQVLFRSYAAHWIHLEIMESVLEW